jgi:hypothetical protein
VDELKHRIEAAMDEVTSYKADVYATFKSTFNVDGSVQKKAIKLRSQEEVDLENDKQHSVLSPITPEDEKKVQEKYIISSMFYLRDQDNKGKTRWRQGQMNPSEKSKEQANQPLLSQRKLLSLSRIEYLGEEPVFGLDCIKLRLVPNSQETYTAMHWYEKKTLHLIRAEFETTMEATTKFGGNKAKVVSQNSADIKFHAYDKPVYISLPEEALMAPKFR